MRATVLLFLKILWSPASAGNEGGAVSPKAKKRRRNAVARGLLQGILLSIVTSCLYADYQAGLNAYVDGDFERAMAKRNMSQAELARTMRTSRTVIHRLLDPRDTSITLATLSKASKALKVKLLKVA